MKVMVIEKKRDELVDNRYAPTVMASGDSLTHWQTIEVNEVDFGYYEAVRLELENLIEELIEKGRN